MGTPPSVIYFVCIVEWTENVYNVRKTEQIINKMHLLHLKNVIQKILGSSGAKCKWGMQGAMMFFLTLLQSAMFLFTWVILIVLICYV